jgi:hypothetical protein
VCVRGLIAASTTRTHMKDDSDSDPTGIRRIIGIEGDGTPDGGRS